MITTSTFILFVAVVTGALVQGSCPSGWTPQAFDGVSYCYILVNGSAKISGPNAEANCNSMYGAVECGTYIGVHAIESNT
jgi:hypothetical protein